MDSIVWWSTLTLVATAAVIDIRCRRIPNWLVVPFLAAGLIFSVTRQGFAGLEKSLGGILLAAFSFGIFCWLRATGMGDLKLCSAVGAWIGFSQLSVALIVMALAGSVMAMIWAARNGCLRKVIDGAGELLTSLPERGLQPHPTLALGKPGVYGMPYAPAILIGTVFSFFVS